MKPLLTLFLIATLAGCASVDGAGNQRTANELRKPIYLRAEQQLPFTFPEIQMALIKHERQCGNAPVFKMNEGQTSYGAITQKNDPADGWNKTILIDLTWLQPTWRQETRVRAEVYSAYGGSAIDQRIRNIYAAINQPDICPADHEAPAS